MLPITEPDLYVWGHTSRLAPSEGELARLAVQAGAFLALHTLRPAPTPQPPDHRSPGMPLTVEGGWLLHRGWRRILPHPTTPAPGAFEPRAVARRLAPARPAEIRQLLDRATRSALGRDLVAVPDGVALALTDHLHVPDSFWGYLAQGWIQSVAGPSHLVRDYLPALHSSIADSYRRAVDWLCREIGGGVTELEPVREALTTRTPGDLWDVRAVLRYDKLPSDTPTASEVTTHRVLLARLVILYWAALESGDTHLTDLVDTQIRR
ncbi:hypothetical protein [Streptomyces sp. NPDC048442]|uniref:hypothetical protein n=1 Tax=Streptomyces sp. NPDC048442 TaxID=3154823 RepID=UPI00341C941D